MTQYLRAQHITNNPARPIVREAHAYGDEKVHIVCDRLQAILCQNSGANAAIGRCLVTSSRR